MIRNCQKNICPDILSVRSIVILAIIRHQRYTIH